MILHCSGASLIRGIRNTEYGIWNTENGSKMGAALVQESDADRFGLFANSFNTKQANLNMWYSEKAYMKPSAQVLEQLFDQILIPFSVLLHLNTLRRLE